MHRMVGFGLIFLLLGYLAWLPIGGSTFSHGETVVINRANGADSSVPTPLELNIVTLLGFDGIQSIEGPRFVAAEVADETYDPTELILGVEIEGDARAYSVPLLSRHEIVNYVVGENRSRLHDDRSDLLESGIPERSAAGFTSLEFPTSSS